MSAEPRTPEEHRRAEAARDNEILYLLLSEPFPWAIEEIVREFHDEGVRDGVARLTDAGLVHRLNAFVFPTRTARRARELHDQE